MQTVSAISKFHRCSGQKNQLSGNLRIAQVMGGKWPPSLNGRRNCFCLFVCLFILFTCWGMRMLGTDSERARLEPVTEGHSQYWTHTVSSNCSPIGLHCLNPQLVLIAMCFQHEEDLKDPHRKRTIIDVHAWKIKYALRILHKWYYSEASCSQKGNHQLQYIDRKRNISNVALVEWLGNFS